MAILNRGFDQTNLNGSVGGVTYRRVGGVTIASQKVPMKSHAKQTTRLMRTRMQWPNMVAVWRAINTTKWHPAFRKDNRRQSDFNMFMQKNMKKFPIWLTKSYVRQGAGVVGAYIVSDGSMGAVSCGWGNNNIPTTDLLVGTLTLGNSTTVAAFSSAIIDNNPAKDFRTGDQLTLLTVLQRSQPGEAPTLTASVIEVTLDPAADTTLLSDIIDVSQLSIVDGKLSWSVAVAGGVAAVHSRLVNGETICSNATLTVNNDIVSQYQSSTAFYTACESYGGIAEEQMLTPNIDDLVSADGI